MKKTVKKVILISLLLLLIYIVLCLFMNYRVKNFIKEESKEYSAKNLSVSDMQLLGNELDITFSDSDKVNSFVYSNYNGLIADVTVNDLTSFLNKNMEDSSVENSLEISDVIRLLRNGENPQIKAPEGRKEQRAPKSRALAKIKTSMKEAPTYVRLPYKISSYYFTPMNSDRQDKNEPRQKCRSPFVLRIHRMHPDEALSETVRPFLVKYPSFPCR